MSRSNYSAIIFEGGPIFILVILCVSGMIFWMKVISIIYGLPFGIPRKNKKDCFQLLGPCFFDPEAIIVTKLRPTSLKS